MMSPVRKARQWGAFVVLTQHHQPLGLLHTVGVILGISERSDVDLAGLVNLRLGSVANKDGLATPLDNDLYIAEELVTTIAIC